MATITAALVKELREKTGAGMMDCKAALEANEGDIEDVPEEVRNVLTFHPVETLEEVLAIALVKPPAADEVKPLDSAA